MLISPDEINLYRKIVATFRKGSDFNDYPIDIDYLDECKVRVNLARKVDELDHQLTKTKNTNNWYEKNAKLLDIELDDEILKETQVDTDKNRASSNRFRSKRTMPTLTSDSATCSFSLPVDPLRTLTAFSKASRASRFRSAFKRTIPIL
jgi:ATP-dependent RNA helicase DDX24/MAK5